MLNESGTPLILGQAIVKIVGPCNLNCSYCYIYNHEDQGWKRRPKTIDEETFERAIGALRRHADRNEHKIGVLFHGGEPLLIGKERFEDLVGRTRRIMGDRLGNLGVQTNGTLIDAEWVEIFERCRMVPGISLDGPPEIHDRARVDHAGRGSHASVLRGVELLRAGGIKPGVLTVVQPGASGLATYEHLRELGFRQIDFLLPDVTHDGIERMYGDAGATPLADYLLPILDRWIEEDDPRVRVRVFWTLLTALMGGNSFLDAFGNPPLSYIVVETDGTLELLDALRVCADGIAATGVDLRTGEVEDLLEASPLVRQILQEGHALCATCRACPERDVCGGGYLPHRFAKRNGFDNPSVWCEDIKLILERMRRYVHDHRAA